jgi:hypothetical protein
MTDVQPALSSNYEHRTRSERPISPIGRLSVSIVFLFLSLAACVPVPIEHIKLYADTAAQTRTAGNALLDRISPIVAATKEAPSTKNCGPNPQTGIPRCFDQTLVVGEVSGRLDPPSVAVDRLALELVAVYAAILADLAEGKSADEVRARVEDVANVAIALAGPLAAATGVGLPVAAGLQVLAPQVKELARKLEAVRAGQIVRQSLIADRTTIKAILAALEDETPTLYRIYMDKRSRDRNDALLAENRVAANEIADDIKQFHAALAAYVRLLRAVAKSLDTLARDAEQSTRPSAQAVQTAVKQAIDARAEAQSLLNAIGQLGGAPR